MQSCWHHGASNGMSRTCCRRGARGGTELCSGDRKKGTEDVWQVAEGTLNRSNIFRMAREEVIEHDEALMNVLEVEVRVGAAEERLYDQRKAVHRVKAAA